MLAASINTDGVRVIIKAISSSNGNTVVVVVIVTRAPTKKQQQQQLLSIEDSSSSSSSEQQQQLEEKWSELIRSKKILFSFCFRVSEWLCHATNVTQAERGTKTNGWISRRRRDGRQQVFSFNCQSHQSAVMMDPSYSSWDEMTNDRLVTLINDHTYLEQANSRFGDEKKWISSSPSSS